MLAKRVSMLAFGLLCAGTVLAHGQGIGGGQNGQGPAQTPASPPSQQAAAAPHQGGIVATHDMTGTLVDIVGGFGLGHPYFEFLAGGTTYSINAAPYKLLTNMMVADLVGSEVRMIFAECSQGTYLALQIISGSETYVFRDDSGKPVWRNWPVDPSPANGNGPPAVDATSIESVTTFVENVGASVLTNMIRVQIRLRDQQRVWVTLGPGSLLLDQGFELQVGDRITLMLATQTRSRERVALQLDNPDTGQKATIRNREGHQYRLMYE